MFVKTVCCQHHCLFQNITVC